MALVKKDSLHGTTGSIADLVTKSGGSPSYSHKEIKSVKNLNEHEGNSSPVRPPGENTTQPIP